MNTKYIFLILILIGFTACNEPEDVLKDFNIEPEGAPELPELTANGVDFSKYVAVGASFTAGFTDNALFKASQANSFPNLLSQKFAMIGGGEFKQPLMNDNFGGLAANGTRIAEPRLVFFNAPTSLESVIGPVTVTTDIVLNNPTGPFNNLGVPGAKSFHLLSNTYGDLAGVGVYSNPYFVRMASSPSSSIIADAIAQNPTFFTLSEIGGNDVLGYALSGGSGVDQTGNLNPLTYGSSDITDPNVFANTFNALVAQLTSNGAKGLVTNVPNITDLAHFTTVPYNPVPLNSGTAAALNQGYAAYNGGLQQALAALEPLGLLTAEEVQKRTITFAPGAGNAMVIIDENLTDLGAINPAFAALPKFRQATAEDLFVLSLSSLIPQGYGTQIALEDKYVLTPEEQMSIQNATNAYNATIEAIASSNSNIALVDLNAILNQLSTTGIVYDDYTLTGALVTGGTISLDGVHLTARGYSYMANKFLEALDDSFGTNFEASGNFFKAGDFPTNYSPALQ
ncbi:SGNH/GDSL hydrolase family protein [Seonamhaeicola marinus]|uniref:G-D-S-L family lipolytic protein n=1 Tax=Seonamhaeicola marinus TaxID=1912246 RepID=A0A5D0HFU3_9FLAO|nr:G-D-S-L family lipolytic protein [Seonamhaeicola marinus]TYA70193.1 G-D-S-L family lipolytic protein [Seonamhaeicola marinus]